MQLGICPHSKKYSFANRDEAENKIMLIHKRVATRPHNKDLSKIPTGTYQCSQCPYWHLTSAYSNLSLKTQANIEYFKNNAPKHRKRAIKKVTKTKNEKNRL